MESERWKPRRYRVRALSTRPFQIEGDPFKTSVALRALHDLVNQVRAGVVLATVEHLTYLPPLARWRDGEVVVADDGESELVLEGADLRQYVPIGPDPQPLAQVATWPEASIVTAPKIEVHYEARNFSRSDADEFAETCPLPLRETHRWSSLPPLEWLVAVPVTWGAAKFVGAFLDELGHAAGKGLVTWIKAASSRTKEPDRDGLLTFQFDLGASRHVYAVVPFSLGSDSSDIESALRTVGMVAGFAGSLVNPKTSPYPDWVRGAFLFDGVTWRFAWWTDGESVYRTTWFEEKGPDPARFLGRPLFPNDPPEQREDLSGSDDEASA
jgi:hypothetical protein